MIHAYLIAGYQRGRNTMAKAVETLCTDGTYYSLFSDGTIGISDGVGYTTTLSKKEVYELYLEMKKLFEDKK